jgi:hypothetical protein
MTRTLLTAIFLTLLSQTALAGNQLICKMNEIVVCALQKCPVEKANPPSKVEIVVNLDTGQLTRTDDYSGAVIYSDCKFVMTDIKVQKLNANIVGTTHYKCELGYGMITVAEHYKKSEILFQDSFSDLTTKTSVGACQKNVGWSLN